MSDDEVDLELLDLLRQRLGISTASKDEVSRDTGVLRDAEFIYNNSIDVLISMDGTKAAATAIYRSMQERAYSTETWSQHELHPSASDGFTEVDLVNFVFTLDLLNFSFWSELGEDERYQVEYRGKRWTGYNSLVACLRRALEEDIPITTPRFWRSRHCSDQLIANVFRSATDEQIPLLEARIANLREASEVLRETFPDPEGEDDDDLADLAPENIQGQNEIEVSVSEAATQAITEEAQTSASQHHNEGGLQESPSPQLASNTKQPRTLSESGEEIDPEIGTPSSNVADSPQVDSLSTQTQTDASASSPHEPASCQNTKRPPGSRQTNLVPDHAVVRLIERADGSAGKLVNLLTQHFPSSFRDEARFDGRRVKLFKRAQIFVADLWAALNARGLGEFGDIDHLTMFPDYRVAQMLHGLGVLSYSPPLDYRVNNRIAIESGHSWEVQIRGCSIWAVELIRREILKLHPHQAHVNAVLIDFFLYDLAKEREANGTFQLARCGDAVQRTRLILKQAGTPHHRTRSIWY